MTPARAQAARVDTWRTVERTFDDIGTEQPIEAQLEFETSTSDLGGGRANFVLDGRHLTWRTAPVEEFSIHGSLNDGVVELGDFRIALERGDLTAFGEWNLGEHAAALQFTSSMDFTTLAPAFPGPMGEALSRLDFSSTPPVTTGRILFDFQDGFHADVQADLDWRDFTFNGTRFDRLTIPVAYDGRRLLIPGLKMAGRAGDVDLEFFFDGTQATPSLNGKITSSLDPTVLKGVFGAGMDNFLGSCAFHAGGPKIEATATGTALKTDAWIVKGKMAAEGLRLQVGRVPGRDVGLHLRRFEAQPARPRRPPRGRRRRRRAHLRFQESRGGAAQHGHAGQRGRGRASDGGRSSPSTRGPTASRGRRWCAPTAAWTCRARRRTSTPT